MTFLVLQVFATKGLSIKYCGPESGQDVCKYREEQGRVGVGRSMWKVKDP